MAYSYADDSHLSMPAADAVACCATVHGVCGADQPMDTVQQTEVEQ